ncbi:citrate lyase acyl carrier protein [Lactiplantibacillus sp. DA1]|uniref:citrate lyase acyl carrier protein n=1 Tax=Lactiplantibacillus sp. DA1 TaxID=3079857 RepID=UPI00292A62A2|nr:citrate lyase acyl carrier protein [Lactiplantibacillus sp. DA1]MDV0429361.1 citrate lyase acyl carrier protein [Lactiplantibacillus sp. DA1]
MKIKTKAIAGTVESSDAQVMIIPNTNGLEIKLDSAVYEQYGTHIIALAKQTATMLGLENATLQIIDKGALDCTIKARIETAFYRATKQFTQFPWEVL